MKVDEIQQLIDIRDRQSAIEYLKNTEKSASQRIAYRLFFKGIEDNTLIAQVTSLRIAEIEELRSMYLTFEEAMDELGLSEKSLKKYIKQGLTVVEQGIPRYAIELMKDTVFSILMQMEYQEKKLKTQTEEERIAEIREEISEFEETYGGKFEDVFGYLFGHLAEGDILLLDGNDVVRWKDLIEELREAEE